MTRALFRVVSWMFLAFVAAIFISLVLLPPLTGMQVRTVVSDSMAPAMPKGSVIVITPTSLSSIHVGEIIAFRSPDDQTKVITHRVAALEPTDVATPIRTKGDANNTADNWHIGQPDLLGAVLVHVVGVGYFVQWATSGIGFLVLIVAPCLYVMIGELHVVYRFIRYGSEGFAS